MIYLISEETTSYMMGVSIRKDIKRYYKYGSIKEVKKICAIKEKELEGTYDENKMSKSIIYKELK